MGRSPTSVLGSAALFPKRFDATILSRKEVMDKTNLEIPREALVTETTHIGIAGMTCDSCVRTVETALQNLKGVKEVAVNREAAIATVTFDNSMVDVPTMHDALLKSGYKPVAKAVD